MQELLLNIENKEILSEILHHSVDYLIGNRGDEYFTRFYYKYGFKNANDFISTAKYIAKCYRNACTDTEMDLLSLFPNCNTEFQQLFKTVLIARRSEILKYNLRSFITEEVKLLKYFDWSLNLIMDSDSTQSQPQPVVILSLTCSGKNETETVNVMELNRNTIDNLIDVLEKNVCSIE